MCKLKEFTGIFFFFFDKLRSNIRRKKIRGSNQEDPGVDPQYIQYKHTGGQTKNRKAPQKVLKRPPHQTMGGCIDYPTCPFEAPIRMTIQQRTQT